MDSRLQLDETAQSDAALLELLDSLDGVVYEYDLRLDRYVVARGSAHALLGYSELEWRQPGFWITHVHPDDVAGAHGFCVDSIQAQRDHQFEYRMMARDGRVAWIRDHVTLVRRDGVPRALRGVMLDITELKQHAEQLGATRDRFAGLLDQLSVGVLFEDARRTILFANRSLCEAFGVESAESLLGADCRVALESLKWMFRDPHAAAARVEELVAGRRPCLAEDVHLRDGRVFERSYVPFHVAGALGGHLWQFQDVTGRRRAERALREVSAATASRTGREFLGVLVRELASSLGASGAFVAARRSNDASRLGVLALWPELELSELEPWPLGGSPCELTLERGELLCDGDFAQRFPKHFAAERLGAASYFAMPLGSSSSPSSGALALLFPGPVPDADGLRSVLRVFADRAGAELERDSIEEALRASEARYRALLEFFPDIIFVVDASGRFIDCHAPEPAQLLLPREQFLGRRLDEVLPPEFAASCSAMLGEAFRARSAVRQEHHVDFGGVSKLFEYRVVVFGSDRAMVIARDVTEQRSQEERRVQAQKLESLGRLAGGVAHDFNNLLTAILSYAELGAREAGAAASGEHFRRIQLAGERAAGLTHQLLAFARDELVAPRVVSVNALVEEMSALLRRVIGEHVRVELQLAPDVWPTRIDPTQFHSVLMNLLLNARDALPNGGEVVIRTRNVELEESSERAGGPWIELTVADDGVGMDDAVRRRAFEPFFTTKGAGAGTGMGLATCYGIVRQNGGVIQVVSEPGRGTQVCVLLPRTASDTTHEKRAALSASRGMECVLLAEDDDIVRELAADSLRRLGYCVLSARNGAEALEFAQAHGDAVDVLVTDIVMPRMGGDALAAALRERRPELPVLFISGYAPPGEVDARGAALLRKPFTPTELARRLREVLDASSPRA